MRRNKAKEDPLKSNISPAMYSLAFLLLSVTALDGVEPECPQKCTSIDLHRWPGSGYRAGITVVSPVMVKRFRHVILMLKFNKVVQRIENVHIRGGSIRYMGSNAMKKEMKLQFRTDNTIRKRQRLKIEYIVRSPTNPPPALIEVKFWRKIACSNSECPSKTTAKPMTTGSPKPTMNPSCSNLFIEQQTGPDFFKGVLTLPVLEEMNGWTLAIQFTKPIVKLSNFLGELVEERAMTYFLIKNFVWNANQSPGAFKFQIMVHFDQSKLSIPKIAMIKFGSFECKVNDALTIPPTNPPTTQPMTTKPPTPAATKKPETTTKEPEVTVKPTTEQPEEKTTPALSTEPPATTKEPEVTEKPTTEKPEEETTLAPSTEPPVTTQVPEVTEKPTTEKPEEETTLAPSTEPPVTTQEPEVTEKPGEKTTSSPTTEPPTKKPETEKPATTKPPVTTKKPEVTTKAPKTESPTTTAKPTPAGCEPKYDYNQVLKFSLMFYEAQRSGKLPASNRIPYRKDSALADGQDVGKDLTGGYYDAGDFVKFGFPMAYTMTVIAWGVIQYEQAYKSAGQYNFALDAIKWGTDYFIKCHTSENEFYGQVGDGDKDHAYWGRAEDMFMARPSMKVDSSKPGSDLAGETAAALAAAHMVFKGSDPSYASSLLKHAKELYSFADKFRGVYSNSIPNAAKFYKSWSGFNDELTWAAAWLYRATNDAIYLNAAKKFYSDFGMGSTPQEFSWDDKKAGVQVLMAQVTQDDMYKMHSRMFCDAILAKGRTPKGLVFISQWGANRHAANVAFICLMAADLGIKTVDYRNFARSQIHYMLGDAGRSYVVGFGKNPPTKPHHRSSSCPNAPATCDWNNFNSLNPNPQVLYGALVGGPDNNDNYVDDRKDYIKNEVALDYNAGFQSAVAALRNLQSEGSC